MPDKVRSPIATGIFYSENGKKLKKSIKFLLKSVKNDEQIKDNLKNIKGAVVPHAGYIYSGKTAAHVYNLLKEKNDFDLFVIFGANHSEYNNLIISLNDFETPLGIVKNSNLTKKIFEKAKKTGINIVEGGAREHSIEVQLPFLQTAINKEFEIIPILIRDINVQECKKIVEIIYNKVKGKKVFVLASSDFTHFGAGYGYLDKNFEKYDKEAIEKIKNLNSNEFLKIAKKTTICGVSAIICCIEFVKLLGAEKGVLLDFTNSSKISGDKSQIVDYAGIVFE